MGLPLLKEAFEPIRAASLPISPPANDADDFRTTLLRSTRSLERADLEYRVTSNRQMQNVEIAAREYVDSGADIEEVVSSIENFRNEIQDGITQLINFINEFEAASEAEGRTLAAKSLSDGRFFRKQLRKGLEHLRGFLATRQRNADRLTVLLAELDPDARGGRAFSETSDLIAHLRGLGG